MLYIGCNCCKLYFLKVIEWCYILGVWMIKWDDLNIKKNLWCIIYFVISLEGKILI